MEEATPKNKQLISLILSKQKRGRLSTHGHPCVDPTVFINPKYDLKKLRSIKTKEQ